MSIKTLNTDSLQTVANANVFPSDAVPDAAQQMCSGLPAQHGCVQHSVCAQLMPMTHPTGRPRFYTHKDTGKDRSYDTLWIIHFTPTRLEACQTEGIKYD